MQLKLIRFTPTKSLTYNNRWNKLVYPKDTLFFIPPSVEQAFLWLDFLCTTHKKTMLYLHTIRLVASTYKVRVLRMWKKQPLLEVMIKERDYGFRTFYRTQRVLKRQKAIPQILKWFV